MQQKSFIILITVLFSYMFTQAQNQPPTYGWTAAATTALTSSLSTPSSGSAVKVDANGNVYTTGTFWGTVDFDPGVGVVNLTSAGGADMFIQKLDASGSLVWVRPIGGAGNDAGNDIALDAAGNVYTTGAFSGTVDFEPGAGTSNVTAQAASDIFIQKLNSSGNLVWVKSFGTSVSNSIGVNIALDASGNVYTTGSFNGGTIDFDPGAGVANLSGGGTFISKLNAAGNYVWAKNFSATSFLRCEGLAVDASGNVYLNGYFQGTVDCDPGPGTANLTYVTQAILAAASDIFISKLDASGNFVWAKQIGSALSDEAKAITVDAIGNVYSSGHFYGGNDAISVDFDPGSGTAYIPSGGLSTSFILKLNSSGDYVWAKSVANSSGNAIALDAGGNVYTTGRYALTQDFDPGAGGAYLSSQGGSWDIFISKYDASGNYIWAKGMGGTYEDQGYALALDASGKYLYSTGYFQNTANMNPIDGTDIKVGNPFGIFTQKLSLCVSTKTINASICAGSSYTFNGIALTSPGMYLDTLTNAAGCDSLITLKLAVVPSVTASISTINPDRCNTNGNISLSSINAYTTLATNNFSGSVAPPYSTTGTAAYYFGRMQLTQASSNSNGAFVYSPSSKPSGFIAMFDFLIFTGGVASSSAADGMSFNYGVLAPSPTGHEDGMLGGNGLVIRFKEWQTQRVEVVYNGVVKGIYDVDICGIFMKKARIAVSSAGKLDISIGDQVLCTDLDLGASYSSDNKNSWQFAWGARTGGSAASHVIDNIEIYSNENGVSFTNDNWITSRSLPFFNVTPNTYILQAGAAACPSTIGTTSVAFDLSNFTTVSSVDNSTCNGRTISVASSFANDTLAWSDFGSRPTLSNFSNLGNAIFGNGIVQLTDNVNSQNGRIIFPQTPNAGVFTATFKARVWDGNNADGFSFNYGQLDNPSGAEGGMMNTNTPGLSVGFPTFNTSNIVVKYKNVVLTTVNNASGNRASTFTPVEVSVNEQYQLTVKWNGTTYINNYDLVANSTYETDAKTTWQLGWGARTGGQNDRHQLDDILVTGKSGLLYSYDGGTTFETSATKTFNNANAVTVVVKADGICSGHTFTLAPITTITPTFTQVSPICSGAALAALPTTSLNGISGTWTPGINNLTTTTYIFTPNSSCNPSVNMTIEVNASPIISNVNASPNIICSGDSSTLQVTTSLPDPIVITFAGSGIWGSTNGAGTAASFADPIGVATDAAGNVFVADYTGHKIRKITPTGVVTTYAGTGVSGNSNGTVANATFSYPIGLTFDPSGNMYIADMSNNRIRKITPAGVVTTFAGSGSFGSDNGAGASASFYSPRSVATDAAGNVYVADFYNNKIRKITPAGVVSTFAGSGTAGSTNATGTAASFNQPAGVATDAQGNVYVADRLNYKIRKITPTGVVTTLAGSGIPGSADGTGTSASFSSPRGVATDVNGNVYVADLGNNKIRKITSAGVVTTLAGTGSAGNTNGLGANASFNQPAGIAIDAMGNVYVAEDQNFLVRKIVNPQSQSLTYTWSPAVNVLNANTDSTKAFPTATTTYTVTSSNSIGCSVTSTVAVTVKPNYTITASAGANGTISPTGSSAVCEGNNRTYTIAGSSGSQIADVLVDGISVGAVSSYTFNNVTSAHTIIANFNGICAATFGTLNQSICSGSFFTFNGIELTSSGTYLDTLVNAGGCDSILTLNLTINTNSTSITNLTIDVISLPYFWNGLIFYTDGSQTAHLTNAVGCDSAATLNLTVANPFVTVWKTNNPGTSNSTSITIPTTGSGYNYDVDWNNDGIYDQFGITGNVTHNYGTAGTYTIAIKGSFPRIYFNFTGDRQKIISILRWGDIAWTSLSKAFMGCNNLTNTFSLADNPNLSAVTDLSFMFYNSTFNQNISGWNVSTVTNMSYMFGNATNFSSEISSWDVSSVTDMSYMFFGASNFNQNIGSWNVGAVTNMRFMFSGASQFNQNIGSWNVGAVTYMNSMFNDVIHFNQNISGWNVSAVTNMNNMFRGATDFNQNISAWNTNAVTNMNGMFAYARNFNQNISPWNVSAVTDMGSMFFGDTIFNQNISSWNVSAVIVMDYMFSEATHFNQNISGWNVSAVTSMSGMFKGATSFNQNISGWNVSAVTNMSDMFNGATAFNQNIGSWNVANVQYMNAMFRDATSFNQNIGPWNVGAVQSMGTMFDGAIAFNQNIGNWNVGAVQFMNGMFRGATAFNQNIGAWNVGAVTDMSSMFSGATSFNQNIGSWNVGAVTDMSSMFSGATSFNQNIGSWNLSSISSINQIFLNSNISQSNYDSILIAWDIAGYSYLYIGNSSPLKYCNSAVARASLLSKGWTITGDAFLCLCVPTASTLNQSICNGSSYLFNGIYQITSGTYLDTLVNEGGCDSIVTLNLTIKSTSTSTTNLSICSTELPYSWNGLSFIAGGSQTYHTTNSVGCDSASTLNLTIKSTSTSTTNLSICSSDLPYSWNGLIFTVGGFQTAHLTNSVGCDSSATLNLTIKSTSISITNLSICSNELPYSWNGLIFIAGGSQTFHTTNSVGCDSAATLNLTIKSTSTSTTNLSICSNELPYSWNGLTFTSDGSQTAHLTNSVGCDSAATLYLTIKSTSTSSSNLSICPSALPFSWNGLTFTVGGSQTFHTTNSVGCDSAATLNLTIKSTSTSTSNLSICSSELPYSWNGLIFTGGGSQTFHTTNSVGCNSTATLNLTLKSTSTSTTNLSICSNELPYSWNGLIFIAGGYQTFHTTNSVGCDSTATLNLTIKATSASTTNLSICSTELPYSWNGMTFTVGGSQTAHLANIVGCDSAATLNLTIKSTSTSTTNLSICSSELPYSWNGLTFIVGGSQTAHLTNSVGCDSAATLNLTIKSASVSSTNLSICSTELPYSWNGLTFNGGGSQTFHTTNSVGCDSAATLNLIIKATSTSTTNLSICSSELPYSWNGLAFTAGGSQTYYTTNAVGCDSAATLNLIIKATSSSTMTASQVGCYTWAANNATYTISGIYSLAYTNAAGCDSLSSLNLTITPSVKLSIKALLAGPYEAGTGLMHDSLRVLGLIPSAEPYSNPPYNKTPIGETNGETLLSSSVLNVTGADAIVDWVMIELRSATNPSTIIANKRALIQRDGDIVSTDGVSLLTFITVPNGNYYVSVKHRNHLGIMSNSPIALSGCSTTSIDFTTSALVYTMSTITNTPRKQIGTVYTMWSGDVNSNKNVKYNGLNNDKDIVLFAVGAGTPNNSIGPVYRIEDANLDGKIRYNNTDNERNIILNNVGPANANNILNQHTPN